MCVILVSSYLVGVRPFLSRRQLNLEVLNEVTEALLLYHILCFSDLYTANDDFKDTLALSFNSVIFLNISIHVSLLICSSIANCRLKCKRKEFWCQKKSKKIEKNPNRITGLESVDDLDMGSD